MKSPAEVLQEIFIASNKKKVVALLAEMGDEGFWAEVYTLLVQSNENVEYKQFLIELVVTHRANLFLRRVVTTFEEVEDFDVQLFVDQLEELMTDQRMANVVPRRIRAFKLAAYLDERVETAQILEALSLGV